MDYVAPCVKVQSSVVKERFSCRQINTYGILHWPNYTLANVLLAVSALSYGIPTVFGTINFDDLRGFSNQPFPSANTSTNETIHLTTHDVIGKSIKTSVDALLKQFYKQLPLKWLNLCIISWHKLSTRHSMLLSSTKTCTYLYWLCSLWYNHVCICSCYVHAYASRAQVVST